MTPTATAVKTASPPRGEFPTDAPWDREAFEDDPELPIGEDFYTYPPSIEDFNELAYLYDLYFRPGHLDTALPF